VPEVAVVRHGWWSSVTIRPAVANNSGSSSPLPGMSAPMAVMWFAPRKAAAGERGAVAAVAVMTHPALIYQSAIG
jgi:hypothetical protein